MKELNTRIIKQKILKEREEMGWTQAQLAEKTGITPAAICQIEKGDRIPTISVLYKIAQVLQVSLDYLAGQRDSIELKDALRNYKLSVLFKKYNKLSAEDKRIIERILKTMPNKK